MTAEQKMGRAVLILLCGVGLAVVAVLWCALKLVGLL